MGGGGTEGSGLGDAERWGVGCRWVGHAADEGNVGGG